MRLVDDGPATAVDKVVCWRCIDLQAQIRARVDVTVTERHVARLLKRLKFTCLSVRPHDLEIDEAAQAALDKTSSTR